MNCENTLSQETLYSRTVWYADDGFSWDGKPPGRPRSAIAIPNPRNPGGDIATWEGQTITSQFTDGVTLWVDIEAGAQYKSTGTRVGTGWNGVHFLCYKDEKRRLWESYGAPYTTSCYSLYYCLVSISSNDCIV